MEKVRAYFKFSSGGPQVTSGIHSKSMEDSRSHNIFLHAVFWGQSEAFGCHIFSHRTAGDSHMVDAKVYSSYKIMLLKLNWHYLKSSLFEMPVFFLHWWLMHVRCIVLMTNIHFKSALSHNLEHLGCQSFSPHLRHKRKKRNYRYSMVRYLHCRVLFPAILR